MGTQKPLLPWPPGGEGTLLGALIRSLQPFTDEVLVVVGRNTGLLAPVIAEAGAISVENLRPDEGQFSSLRVGLREVVARGFSSAMICPVDGPPLRESSLSALVGRFGEGGGEWGVAPRMGEKRGHPLLARRELIEAFLAAPAEGNAKAVRNAHEARMVYLDVDDAMVGVNANTPEEFAALCAAVSAASTS